MNLEQHLFVFFVFALLFVSPLFLLGFLLLKVMFLFYFDHGVDQDNVQAKLKKGDELVLDAFEKNLGVLVAPSNVDGVGGVADLWLPSRHHFWYLCLLSARQNCGLFLCSLFACCLLLLNLLALFVGACLFPAHAFLLPLDFPFIHLFLLLLLLLVGFLLLLLGNDLSLAGGLGGGRLAKRLKPLLLILLNLGTTLDLHALLDHLAELLDLFKGLLVFLFHFTYDFERPVLLTEDAVVALPFDSLHFKEVVGTTGALNMEGNFAA